MKQKPILVFISRHEIPPAVMNDLRSYDVRQITNRAYTVDHMLESIELVCGDRAPLVIAATMPQAWVVPFIQACRVKWTLPGVTIIRVCMKGDHWLGWYARRTLSKDGRLLERPWIPQGSEADRHLQAIHRTKVQEADAPLERLDEMFGE